MLNGTPPIFLVTLLLSSLATFSSIDEAAIAGLASCAKETQKVECGGVVYKTPEGYVLSPTVLGRWNGLDLSPVYKGQVVADFHTHICSKHSFPNQFSPADVYTNQGLRTVGYMLSLCTHQVRRYDPSQDIDGDIEVDFHSGRVLYLTSGHIVGFVY